MRKKKNTPKLDPGFMDRQKMDLVHNRRQVVYLNKMELAAIDEYCRQFKISSRSAMYRKAIMEAVLRGLDANHPTLF